jgi:hypothetical protein
MTGALLPIWIIGGPFIALLILSSAFKGPSAMSGRPGHRMVDGEPMTRKSTVPY